MLDLPFWLEMLDNMLCRFDGILFGLLERKGGCKT